MTFDMEKHGIFSMVTVSGHVGDDDSQELRSRLERALHDPGEMVLDLDGVNRISTHSLGSIVHAWKKAGVLGRNFIVICGQRYVREVMECLNLKTIMKIYDSQEQFRQTEGIAETRTLGDFVVVEWSDEMGIAVDHAYLNNLLERLHLEGHRNIVLNMTGLCHVYSRVLGVMVQWAKRLRDCGGRLHLLGANPEFSWFLEASGLGMYFIAHKDESSILSRYL